MYEIVQAFAERVPGLKREQVFKQTHTPALGGDLTSVRCNGQWLPLGLTVDDTTGLVLTVDDLSGEDAETLKVWIKPIAEVAGVRAEEFGIGYPPRMLKLWRGKGYLEIGSIRVIIPAGFRLRSECRDQEGDADDDVDVIISCCLVHI